MRRAGPVFSDPAPNRLIVKVRENTQLGGSPAAAVDAHGLALMAGNLGAPEIEPLLPPAAVENGILSAVAAVPHPAARVFVFNFPATVNLDSIKTEIEAQPWVEYAEYDRLMHLFTAPNDPLFSWQWGLENIGQLIPVVDRIPGGHNDKIIWVNGTPGADVNFGAVYAHPGPHSPVLVGIIDTGSDTEHEDLADHLWRNPGEIPDNGIDDDHNGYIDDYFGYDFSGDSLLLPHQLIADSDPTDIIGHGTHVAGTVAAVTDNALGVAGLAGSAKIMTLKIFPNAYNSVAARAIYYAIDNGVDVFNMSFGSPWPSVTVSDALAYARRRGVLPVAASGNGGAEEANYPSSDASVISIGALDYTGHVAFFSSYGDYLAFVAPGVSVLSLRAQGTDMYDDGPSPEPDVHVIAEKYYLADGTSMAAPHMVGCAAALLAIESGISTERLIEVMQNSCTDLVDPFGTGESYPGWDKYSGHGVVNLGRALNELAGITLKIISPGEGDVLTGWATIAGTAAGTAFTGYQLEYGAGADPTSWTTLTSSTEPIIKGPILLWNTAGLTGTYTLRLRAGSGHEDRVTVTLANTTVTQIASPADGDTVAVVEIVRGSTVAPDYMRSIVCHAPQSNPGDTVTVWSGAAPVVGDSVCNWTVSTLSEGWYYLKLATITLSTTLSDSVLVYVKNPFHPGWPVSFPFYTGVASVAADLDRDGKLESIVPTQYGLYLLKEDGSVAPGWPPDTLDHRKDVPAIADLDSDGRYEIIVAMKDYLQVLTATGESYSSAWPREFASTWGLWGKTIPLICDLDGDYAAGGSLEILGIDKEGTVRAFDREGNEYVFAEAGGPLHVEIANTEKGSIPRPSVVDLDGNPEGNNELIVAGDGLWIWDAETGAPYNNGGELVREYFQTDGMVVGNFDFDPELEIAVVYIPPDDPDNIWHAEILEADGTSLPGWPISTGVSWWEYLLGTMAAGDLDGDGVPEIFIAPYFMGRGVILAYRADGTSFLPENADGIFFEHSSSLSMVTVVDVTGDGRAELVFKATSFWGGPDYLYALNTDGEIVPGYPLLCGIGMSTQPAAPLVVDINSDGLLNILTLDAPLKGATVWDFSSEFSLVGRIWPKFRRDNWNTGVLPRLSPRHIPFLIHMINYFFRSGPEVPPYEQTDMDCNGQTSLLDVIYLINYIYRLGPEPCPP